MTTPGYVYVASSWRNPLQPAVVHSLRAYGVECYDFRAPETGTAFRWTDLGAGAGMDPVTDQTPVATYLQAMEHPLARAGYAADMAAMERADTFVLVLPCGRSAHLELGWAAGAGKRTAVLLEDPCVPELMYAMVDYLAPSLFDLLGWLKPERDDEEAGA